MTSEKTIKAWHWTSETLRDGSPIPPVGEWVKHEGEVVLCASGYHGSRRILDALKYAPGPFVHRVEMRGDIFEEKDKMVARERRILWSLDGTDILHSFARRCALDTVHLWEAPEIVIQYLKTGRKDIRAAAWDVAWAAAEAARAAAWAAAGAAAWAAAEAAAGAAAGAAGAAAGAAEREKQNRRLTSMVCAAR